MKRVRKKTCIAEKASMRNKLKAPKSLPMNANCKERVRGYLFLCRV